MQSEARTTAVRELGRIGLHAIGCAFRGADTNSYHYMSMYVCHTNSNQPALWLPLTGEPCNLSRVDDRRIEVIANGLPMWGGSQPAVDTTLVSPLTRSGEPRSRGGTYAGAALQDARRNKERTYPELLQNRRCRLVVLGIEVGGMWSNEASNFIRMLANARARSSPPSFQAATRAALVSRWSALLTHAAATSFAASLLFEDLSPLAHASPAVPASRLPAR